MQPFAFWNCDRVTIKNLGIDWRRPLFSTGTVVGVDAHTVTFRPLPDGALQGGEPVVSFQTARADGVPSGICLFEGISRVERSSESLFRIYSRETVGPVRTGDMILLRHIYSYAPMVHLFGCREAMLENVRIHAGRGWGSSLTAAAMCGSRACGSSHPAAG